jgi:DDE superfamily endonuclease
MEPEASGIEAALDAWLAPFLDVMGRVTRRRWAPLYLHGLLGPDGRRSLQPLAGRLGLGGHDQLQHFIASPAWDDAPLRRVLAGKAGALVGGPDAVLVVDDTALPKKGGLSVGVAQQHGGALGKRANSDVRRQRFGARRRDPAALRAAEVHGWCAEPGAEPLGRRLADSDARVGHRIPVCSSGAASICQRASTEVGHTIRSRVPHRGSAPGAAQQGCRRGTVCSPSWRASPRRPPGFRLPGAARSAGRWPTGRRPSRARSPS